MSVVSISLDTGSRQMALTIDGVLVPFTDLSVERYVYGDGEVSMRFFYTIESVAANGMKEKRQFYLPHPEEIATESHGTLDGRGLASKKVYDDNKAKADVIEFLQGGL